jgi:hypothetical protein
VQIRGHLKASTTFFISTTLTDPTSAQLTDLRLLKLRNDYQDLGPFFDQLTLPALRHLIIAFRVDVTWANAHFMEFLSRSNCSLETLVLQNAAISQDELMQCLRMVQPTLTHLEVKTWHSSVIKDDILKLFRDEGVENTEACLCPNLQVIKFLGGAIEASDCVLSDMVKSRWCLYPIDLEPPPNSTHGVARLDLIEFEFITDSRSSGHSTDLARLKELRDDGLRMKIFAVEQDLKRREGGSLFGLFSAVYVGHCHHVTQGCWELEMVMKSGDGEVSLVAAKCYFFALQTYKH